MVREDAVPRSTKVEGVVWGVWRGIIAEETILGDLGMGTPRSWAVFAMVSVPVNNVFFFAGQVR